MGGSSTKLSEKHVVIVGGGYGGIALANQLQGKCKMTLIDPKECFHHCIGSLRAVVEEGFGKKLFIPYAQTYGENFKRGTVISINTSAKKVVLESEEEITYDYLVIATGTTSPFPAKLDPSLVEVSDAIKMYNDTMEKIKAAKDIVIIGGGPVGIELAGEIVTDMKDKKVTLIHSKPVLVDNGHLLSDKFRTNLHGVLVDAGVNVLLEERVSNLADLPTDGSQRCTVTTEKGTTVEADLVFVCIGMKVNTSAYSEAFGGKMDDIGCLKVDEFLHVEGATDVFSIGDCCTANESAKTAKKAGDHADMVAKNIKNYANGNPLQAYKKPTGEMMIVPVGRNRGVGEINGMIVGNFVSKTFKCKTLFLPKFWGDMKQKMPKD